MRKQKLTLYIACFLIICFGSCKKGAVVSPGKNLGKNLVLTASEQQAATAGNSFTLKLFKNLDSSNTSGANLFVSPLSVSFALGMTSNGAAGQTFTAFENTLNFAGLTQAQMNTYYNNLITNLPQLDPNTTLDIANSIWYKQGFSVEPQFLQTDSSNFHASVQSLDFSSPAALTTINGWVSNNTGGYIPSIINSIPAGEIMYLVNAIYFKSSWKESFNTKNTAVQSFYLADNSQVQASFMSSSIDYNYYYDSPSGTNIFELPYSNSKFSMDIVLPASGTSVNTVLAGLDSAKWQSWMNALTPTKNTITMPKFKFSYSTSLNKALMDLGLKIAFSDGADFSLINAGQPLKITDVEHKGYVETDESGTTAAAATSVGIGILAIPASPPSINRPFIFVIRQMSSGVIVFAGVVNNPLLTGS